MHLTSLPQVCCKSGLVDPELDAEYCSGLFSDELDQLGMRQQVAAGFRINRQNLRGLGRVRTLRLEAVETDDEQIQLGLGFLAELSPGDLLVVQGCETFAYFGEMMTRLSLRAGLSGVVIDGLTRDSYFTQSVELPILSRGYTPVDIKGRGRVAAVDEPVVVGGVACSPGDYAFVDNDAAVFIPQEQAELVFSRVRGMAQHERSLKAWIEDGWSVREILAKTKGF